MSLVLDRVGLAVGADPVISDVSLTLQRGSMTVLLGPTLAGKTTLMRLMAGLDQPSTGRLLLDGRDVTGLPVRKRSVAMVYQQFVNYPNLTVFENIASPCGWRGFPRPRSRSACTMLPGCCVWRASCSACRPSFPAASSRERP